MGGTLDATAEPGRGAMFRLALPLKRAASQVVAEETDAKRTSQRDEALRTSLILLAEDHPTNRRVVELILKDHPVRLVTVEKVS